MPVFQKITIITIISIFITFQVDAEEFWRLRYSIPTSGKSEITRGLSKASEKLNVSGHSGNMVFPNGIGFGYTTVRSKGSLIGIDYKFKNHSLDLSYTIGNEISLTLGAARLVYGRAEQGISGKNYVTESSNGGALYINFGIPFLGGELLLGYRQNNIEYKNFQSRISGQTIILEDSIELVSSQINAGIGFLF